MKVFERMMQGREKYKISLFWIINIIVWLALYGNLCVRHQGNSGDYYLHNQYVELLIGKKMFLMYPGYHILVGIGTLISGMGVDYVSVVVLTAATSVSVYVTYKLLVKLAGEYEDSRGSLFIMAFLLNIVQPIFIQGIAPGYSSGNGYVSPTQIVCKPAALWSVYLFYTAYKEQHYNLSVQIKLVFTLILSCLFKPLFAMAFVPAMGILLGIEIIIQCKKEGILKRIVLYIKAVWPLILTGCFLILQYLYSFQIEKPAEIDKLAVGDNAHIRLGFMHAWKMVVSNVWLSILFAYFFPIIMMILCWRGKKELLKSRYAKICFAYGIVSFIYISCLYQDGGYEMHMNFRNAWSVTFSMIYCGSAAVLLKMRRAAEKDNEIDKEKKELKKKILIAKLGFTVHVIFGLALMAKNIFF